MVYFLTHTPYLDIRGVKSNRNIIPLESQNFYSVRKQYAIPYGVSMLLLMQGG